MASRIQYWRWKLGILAKRSLDRAALATLPRAIALLRRFDRLKAADTLGALMRRVGPHLKEHRIGRANLAAAFPTMPPDEIERILAGVWDNLGRVASEFVNLDKIAAGGVGGPTSFIDYEPHAAARFDRMRDEGRPALVFTAHLANWELPAVVAKSAGMRSTVLFRRPNMRSFADVIVAMRKDLMGNMVASGFDAPIRLARALEDARAVGMLVDQHDHKGIEVTFFGRPCRVSPLIAMLARQYDCAIHGVRVIRRPGGRFTGDLTDAITPVRDQDGRIEVAGTMQVITSVVEEWVREHPDQWLWLHRRWR
jgi:KDO2-lipid IV(A) lauroyltransferase